ncbi:hypothetical protein R3W88_021692 [Solanum pinnatisectum]|uniref:Neprosin PEP catalytic domain-containing protein n=1 Tax=Solanum pinnatisectum TaxID=50273 RepID=A0AAV9LVX7_9SOLN|nr:hypothetical protein R3W88_021692 [Solanum pinnatisectum]
MHQKTVQQTLLMLYFLLSYNGVEGQKKLSKLEDVELEKQLKSLNKPAVKTVKTKYGDTYDCVDFYKQRAFDHPLLKDHNFHPKMKPTLSRIKKDSTSSSATNRSSTIWSKDGGCPFGTIPVKRITRDDLIRLRRMPPPEDATFEDEYDVAIAQVPYNPNSKFAGAGMDTALYNPQVNGQQHSGSRLKIRKGSDILQVGWRVDPTLYGDTNTRLFIHFQAGKIHCFNTLCPGFVHVNKDIPLDGSFMDTISQRGGDRWGAKMYIDRDLDSGNWWVLMTKSFVRVGFWPQSLFTDLKSFATNVDWGGVVYSPPGVPEPPMGSSYFPTDNSAYDAYCSGVTIFNEKGKSIEVERTITHTDNPNMYKVEFIQLSDDADQMYFVLYGGPGESTPV